MSSEPLVFTSGPANDKGVDRAELLLKLRGVESAEVAHPARQDRANPSGDLRQFQVASTMHSPTAYAQPHPLVLCGNLPHPEPTALIECCADRLGEPISMGMDHTTSSIADYYQEKAREIGRLASRSRSADVRLQML